MLEIDSQEIRRILVRQVNWVGDAVLTLPALEALDRRFPRAEIVALAKPWVAGLFSGQPAVDRVIEYRSEEAHRGLLGRWRLARQLRNEHFDLALIFPNSLDAVLIPWLAGIPCRIGYATDGRRPMLTHPIRPPAPGGAHQVHRYLGIIRALGGNGRPEPRLCVTREAWQAAERILADHGIGPGQVIVGLNPGSVYGGAKRWPADRYAAVADALVDGWGARILLLGSARERPVLEEVATRMRRRATSLGGRTDLPTLAALLQRTHLLLSNDTGAMHLAVAVGTPVVAIFGPTDAEGTGPLGSHSRIVREPVPCSPCLLRECPIDHRCMTTVSVGRVLEAASELLSVARASRRAALGASASPCGAPAAFLDRDGTIIEDCGYLGDPDGIRLLPGAVEGLRALRRAGYRLILVTNQAGVARGLLTEDEVRGVNERLNALLTEAGVPLDGMYYCPHHPDHGPPQYRMDCGCRKPRPGMVRQAVHDLALDPVRSAAIGDHVSDASLALAFPGMRGILVLTGHGSEEWRKIQGGALPRPEHVAPDLGEAVTWFLTQADKRDGVASHPA